MILTVRLHPAPPSAIIEHVRDGSSFRILLLPTFQVIPFLLSGVQCPMVHRSGGGDDAEGGGAVVVEKFADEVNVRLFLFFIDCRYEITGPSHRKGKILYRISALATENQGCAGRCNLSDSRIHSSLDLFSPLYSILRGKHFAPSWKYRRSPCCCWSRQSSRQKSCRGHRGTGSTASCRKVSGVVILFLNGSR